MAENTELHDRNAMSPAFLTDGVKSSRLLSQGLVGGTVGGGCCSTSGSSCGCSAEVSPVAEASAEAEDPCCCSGN